MIKLVREDFTRVDLEPGKYYYRFICNLLEIDIEPCAGGFCVAIFDMKQKHVFPRQCTEHEVYDRSYEALIGERRKETWDRALEIAGERLDKFPVIL